MTQRVATPGELQRWAAEFAPLPQERADAVMRLVSEVVGVCPTCEEPVRRCDPRWLVGDQLAHLACAPPLPPTPRTGAAR